MMFTAILAALPLCGGPQVNWSAPGVFVQGQPYKVHVEITAPKEGAVVASWLFTEGAFTIDGKPLGERRGGASLTLPAGLKLTGKIDLAPELAGLSDFQLACSLEGAEGDPVQVSVVRRAPQGLDFQTIHL